MARCDLPEQHLFREILRPDHHARPGRTSPRQRGHQDEYRRSIHPSTSSAAIAISAAGTAPARIVFVSAIAMPRKTKIPNPPPPIAAAMVAVPIVVTVAMRIPARMAGNASGSFTPHRIRPPVIPIATADSRTPESTPRIPTTVFRRIGRRAYKMSARIATGLPTPPRNGGGRRKPNIARLGTVWTTFTTPRVQRRSRACRVRITAEGAAIATAANTAMATSHRCSADNVKISAGRMRFVECPVAQGREERSRLRGTRLNKLIRPRDHFEPPFLQQRDPGSEHHRFANVVGDEERSLTEGLPQSRELLLHLEPRYRVERRKWFIE